MNIIYLFSLTKSIAPRERPVQYELSQYEVDLAEPVEAIYALVPKRDSFKQSRLEAIVV